MEKGAVMPETREWPPALRRLAKLSLGIIYAGSAIAGWHVVLSGEHASAPWWSIALGFCAGLGGALGLIFMLFEFWMAERPAGWLAAFALSVYALIDGARLIAASIAAGRAGWPMALERFAQPGSIWGWQVNLSTVSDFIGATWGWLGVVLDPPLGPDVGGTALLYVSAAAVGLRIVHLWAFDLNIHKAKERAEAARRRRAPDPLELT